MGALLAEGWSVERIAREFRISERTAWADKASLTGLPLHGMPADVSEPIPREKMSEQALLALEDSPEGFRRFFETYSPYTPDRPPPFDGLAAHSLATLRAAYHYCEVHEPEGARDEGTDRVGVARPSGPAAGLQDQDERPDRAPAGDAVRPLRLPRSPVPGGTDQGTGHFFPHGLAPLPPPGLGFCSCGWEEQVVENIGPRFAKSEIWSNWFIVWRFCIDRTTRVILVSKTKNLMQQFVGYIAKAFVDPQLVAAYGPFKPEEGFGKLSDGELNVEGRNLDLKELSLRAKGSGDQLPGLGADWIIVDDPHNADNVTTSLQRDKLEDWFATDCYSRLEPGGHLIVIGMRYNEDDLYGRLVSTHVYDEENDELPEGTENPPAWKHIVFPALYDPQTGEPSLSMDAVSLWPERWPPHALRKKRNSTRVGPSKFDANYQQQPSGKDSLVFDPDHIYGGAGMFTEETEVEGKRYRGCLDLDRRVLEPAWPRERSVRVASADPATANFAAITLADVDRSSPRFRMAILDVANMRVHGSGNYKSRLLENLSRWVAVGPIDVLLMEENNSQDFARTDPDIVEFCRNHHIRIQGHKTYGNKGDPELGFEQMAVLLYTGDIRFPYADIDARILVKHWADEARNYRRGLRRQRTDKLMSAWFIFFAQKLLFRRYVASVQSVPRYPVRGVSLRGGFSRMGR